MAVESVRISTTTLQRLYMRTHEWAMRGPRLLRPVFGITSYLILCEMTDRIREHVAREAAERRRRYEKDAWN